jgi:hypothetical protein
VKIWTVLAFGEGFLRGGSSAGFELYGVVAATDSNMACSKVISLARQRWPEIDQAYGPLGPGAVINVDEVNEVPPTAVVEVDVVEVHWHDASRIYSLYLTSACGRKRKLHDSRAAGTLLTIRMKCNPVSAFLQRRDRRRPAGTSKASARRRAHAAGSAGSADL